MTDRMGWIPGSPQLPRGASVELSGDPVLRNAVSIVVIIGAAIVILPVYLLMIAACYRPGRYYYGS